MVADDPRRPGEVYLICPKCRYEIKDTQNGRYVPHNEGADYNSYHVSQLSSKFITPKEIWEFWKRTTNKAEFWNAKLGLPYIDSENVGVTLSQLKSCIKPDLSWAEPNKVKNPCAMGVDQGAGYLMVTIADLHEGQKRLRHVEIIEQYNPRYKQEDQVVNPFNRLAEIMREYNVQLAVVDAMPNTNDSTQFCRQFPGRAFIAYYSKDSREVVQWNDRNKYKPTVVKAGPLLKFKHTAILGRFPSLDFMFGELKGGKYIIPDPDRLKQMAFDEKTNVLTPEAPTSRLFSHLTRLVKRFHETNEETGDGRWDWIYTGSDPHLAHSLNYCNVALERLKKRTLYTFA